MANQTHHVNQLPGDLLAALSRCLPLARAGKVSGSPLMEVKVMTLLQATGLRQLIKARESAENPEQRFRYSKLVDAEVKYLGQRDIATATKEMEKCFDE